MTTKNDARKEEDIGITPGSLKIYKVSYPGFKCTCPVWNEETKTCVHIEPYKTFFFDPYWIEDNFDNYPEYTLEQFKGATLDDLIKELPRWSLDYIIHGLLEEHSKEKLNYKNYSKFSKTIVETQIIIFNSNYL